MIAISSNYRALPLGLMTVGRDMVDPVRRAVSGSRRSRSSCSLWNICALERT
jgi:hypothetical protein